MPRPKSTISAVTPKIILVLAFLCLMIPAICGLLGSYRVDALRADVANANARRDASVHRRVAEEADARPRHAAVAGEEAKITRPQEEGTAAAAEPVRARTAD